MFHTVATGGIFGENSMSPIGEGAGPRGSLFLSEGVTRNADSWSVARAMVAIGGRVVVGAWAFQAWGAIWAKLEASMHGVSLYCPDGGSIIE
jgi:hypothetical protein